MSMPAHISTRCSADDVQKKTFIERRNCARERPIYAKIWGNSDSAPRESGEVQPVTPHWK